MNKKLVVLKTISKILKIKVSEIKPNLKIGDIKNWDSLSHIKIYIELNKIFKYKNDNNNNLPKVKSVKDWINFFK